jgi:hypothetical protein
MEDAAEHLVTAGVLPLAMAALGDPSAAKRTAWLLTNLARSPVTRARMYDAGIPAAVRALADANATAATATATSAGVPAGGADVLTPLATLLIAASVTDGHFPGSSLGLDLIPYGITYENDKHEPLFYACAMVRGSTNNPAARPGDLLVGINGRPLFYDLKASSTPSAGELDNAFKEHILKGLKQEMGSWVQPQQQSPGPQNRPAEPVFRPNMDAKVVRLYRLPRTTAGAEALANGSVGTLALTAEEATVLVAAAAPPPPTPPTPPTPMPTTSP